MRASSLLGEGMGGTGGCGQEVALSDLGGEKITRSKEKSRDGESEVRVGVLP